MTVSVYSVVVDCPDASALADFYSAVTGLERTTDRPDWVVIGGTQHGGWRIAFQQTDKYLPPRWPDPNAPQQFHLDLLVDDIEAAETMVLKLGARRLRGSGEDFRVYADPVGHPFCLVWQ
jgi:catechol 2,3-dioxygenase-like lactoylglutathione lyase family enzyme